MNKAKELFDKILVDGQEIDLQELDTNNGIYSAGSQKTLKVDFVLKKKDEIPAKIFTGLKSLKNVKVPETVTTVGAQAFANTGAEITGLEQVETFGEGALIGAYMSYMPEEFISYIQEHNPEAFIERYTATEAAAYNAQLPGAKTTDDWKIEPVEAQEAVEAQPAIYSFESYDSEEKTTKYGEGKVKVIEMRAGGAIVEVTENISTDPNAENFVGQQFNVATGLATNEPIQLYTLQNEPIDIWVVVTLESEAIEAVEAVEAVEGVKYTQEEADAYNAQLQGAVAAGDIKVKSQEESHENQTVNTEYTVENGGDTQIYNG